ncbi:MAG: N(5)-(carboxyethyl)ornithine synthase [Thermoanaerobaculia bacterium]|nr:N(5)-(carboxyethyl)ornithine synthase [Thermoanaerobaculia bacterium]
MSRLAAGIVATSRKENERRVAIHPSHLPRISERTRAALTFETGYGEPFGVSDDRLRELGAKTASRVEVMGGSDLVLLPKPLSEDLREMRDGAVLWGWPHCVQQREITQAAIDRRLTLIAFEAMFAWERSGARGLHTFYKNNELAGYCGVLHALELAGWDGAYGPRRSAVILGFGSVSRGAIYALRGRGFDDLTVLTQRPPHLVRDQLPGCRHGQMRGRGEASGPMRHLFPGEEERPLAELLAASDLIVNGTLQDPERPLFYLAEGDETRLRPGAVIVDVSCDEGMGFPFARPTSFEAPAFRVGQGALYYAVDHTPTYLWDSASWEISEALLPYLESVLAGPSGWVAEPTIDRSIEIREGVVQNPTVLSFQGRSAEYPHTPL